MSASTASEAKSVKKRKAKPEAGAGTTTMPDRTASQDPASTPEQSVNGTQDSSGESQYLREINKNIRNVHKKIAASSRTDAIIADHPELSLDDLIAAKKINQDQKAQVLKKPALQSQLAQLEEQVTLYKNFGQEYEARYAKEKEALRVEHETELNQAKEIAATEAHKGLLTKHDSDLLLVSQFLHAAAAKRQSEAADTAEGRAFEGVLLLAYQGNKSSLETLQNLVNGTEDKVPDTQGELLDVTYAEVKKCAMEYAPPLLVKDEEVVEDSERPVSSPGPDENTKLSVSDPTIAHAGLTELEDTAPTPNVSAPDAEGLTGPEQSSVSADAANASAESNWDPQASIITVDNVTGDGWVEVPRDPAETDTGLTATPAAMHGASNWAEEVTEGAVADEKAAAEHDGFEQVVHHTGRGRGRGRGEFRGRGARGDRTGRGRGDGEPRRSGRGRGRGDPSYRGGNTRGRARDTNTPGGEGAAPSRGR